MEFKSREEIRRGIQTDNSYHEDLLEQLIGLDLDKITFDDTEETKVVQTAKQREYFWLRAYLPEEYTDIEPNDEMVIEYVPTGEQLKCTFGSFQKTGMNRDVDDLVSYVTDEDYKILCILIDLDFVNNSDEIPTIRTMFKSSRHYKPELYFKKDILLKHGDDTIEYKSLSF